MAQRPAPISGRPNSPVDETTAGGRLRALRLAAKFSQEEMGAKLGVGAANVSRYEHGVHNIPDHTLERAAQVFGVTAAFLRYGDTESRMVQVRGRVGAGGNVEAIEAPPWRYVEIPASWTDALALEIQGLSGYPIYEDKDVIVVRGEQRLVESEFLGKMCVAETRDGLGLLKRVRRGSSHGLYTLESLNAPPMEDVALLSARPIRLHLSQ